ncbi:MAG: hypothetical protein H3C30_13470 [Candidatus Hydrogenedentes bacterium]|nr:hypothetical protein [Candidatus Hydrogenedentota bacterium]
MPKAPPESVGRSGSADLHLYSREEESPPGPTPEFIPEAREAFNGSTPAPEDDRPVADGVGGGAGLAVKDGQPAAVGNVVAGIMAGLPRQPAREGKRERRPPEWARKKAAEIMAITREPPQYADWWERVVGLCNQEQREVLQEAMNYARDCMDPVARIRKDLGELKKPGAYIASKLMEAGVKLPPKPAVRARGWGQAC